MRTRALSEVTARELRPLLEEETEHWRGELLWDYADVSQAVASGLDRHALTGFALQNGLRTVAYCYYMLDAGRAIVGSLFAAAGFRSQGIEEDLLAAVLADAQSHPANDRVECQTLFSTAPTADARFTRAGFKSRCRHYLVRELRRGAGVDPAPLIEAGGLAGPPAPPSSRGSFRVRPFRRDDIGASADIIHRSHEGSLDAALNLTYASPGYCRGFVETLVLRSGCGRFDPDASFVVAGDDGLLGVLLASRLSSTNGHICQVSVAPDAQGQGLGRLLMASTLEAFRRDGLSTASLSVTLDNHGAYRLYTKLGFRLRKEFAAHAWVRPPARIDL